MILELAAFKYLFCGKGPLIEFRDWTKLPATPPPRPISTSKQPDLIESGQFTTENGTVVRWGVIKRQP